MASSRCSVSRSQAFSQIDTTTQATALLMVLVSARASDMKRSMPMSTARPETGMPVSMVDNVATSVMNPAPVTPAAPFEVSSSTPSSVGIINNNPELRWKLFSLFGASKICPEMLKRSVSIRLQDRSPAIGRFFPMQCTYAVDEARQVVTVSMAGTGYGYMLPAKRVGFSLTAAVEYRPDFVIAGDDLYVWAKLNRIVDGLIAKK